LRIEKKPIIYIVDDERSVRKAMKRLILSMEMNVETFTSGQEFLDSDFKDRNACLISDIKMLDMTGLELQKKLTARGHRLPVIFITAFDTDKIREEAKEAGASGYFQKPVDGQALLDTIQWILSNQPS